MASRPERLRRRDRERHQEVRRLRRRQGHEPQDQEGRVLLHARPVGVWQDHHPAHGGGVRAADRGRDLPRQHAGRRRAAVQAAGQHRVPELRPVPAPVRVGEHRLRPQAQGRREEGDRAARRRGHRDGRDGVDEGPQAGAALGRPAAARGARPGARQRAHGAPARRAARRPRRQAAQGHAARAQEDAERGRDHVHLRDPRPGRGAHHERPSRRDEPGPGRADRHPDGDLREPRVGLRRQLHRRVQHLPVRRGQGRQRRRRVPHRQGPAASSCRSTARTSRPATRSAS